MALSQFGGRPGSGSGSGAGAGKEIGELVLVPSSFTSADFAEAGQTVTSATLPSLYNSLKSNATGVANLVPHPAPATTASISINARSLASFIRGSDTYLIIDGGRIVKSGDGLTWTEAAPLPLAGAFEKQSFSAVNTRQMYNVIAGTVGNTSVAISMSYGKAIAFKTTDGVNWTRFSDAVLDNAAFLNGGTIKGNISSVPSSIGRNVWFSADKAIMVVPGAKKVLASDDALVWRDVTGTIPTTSFAQSTSLPVHADGQSLTVLITPTVYTSVDNGATWKSATVPYVNGTTPNAFTNFCRFQGNLYFGAFNASSVVGFYRTTDLGTTWVYTNGSSVSGTTVATYNTAMYTDGTTIRVNSFGANRTYSTTDGSAWSLSTSQTACPISNTTGLWYLTAQNRLGITDASGTATVLSTDSINSTVSPTLVVGSGLQIRTPTPIIEAHATNGSVFVGLFQNSVTTSDIILGTESTMEVITLPVSDKWIGVCWHQKAQRFFLTGATSTSAYTSTDGRTWTALVNGVDLPQSAANTYPMAGGDCVVFIPRVSTNTAATYGLIFDDGTIAYTVGNLIQSNTSVRYNSTVYNASNNRSAWISGTSVYWNTAGLEVVTSGTVTQQLGSLPASMSAGSTPFALANDRLIAVIGTTAYVSVILPTGGLGVTTSFTLPAAVASYSTILVDGDVYTIISQGWLYAYQTVDFGVTWSAVPVTGLDKSANIYGATMLNGTPLIFTNNGVMLGTTDSGIKVIPQYTSSTPGQKYVVKAK